MNDNPEASDCVNTIVLFVNTGLRVFSETLTDQVFWTTSPFNVHTPLADPGGGARDAKQWRIQDFSPIPNGNGPNFLGLILPKTAWKWRKLDWERVCVQNFTMWIRHWKNPSRSNFCSYSFRGTNGQIIDWGPNPIFVGTSSPHIWEILDPSLRDRLP